MAVTRMTLHACGLLAALLLTVPLPAALAQDASSSPPGEEKLDEAISGFDEPEPMPGKDRLGGSKEGEGEALEQGFDDDEEDTAAAEGPAEAEFQAEEEGIRWSLDGFVRLDASYNFAHDAPAEGQTDYRGLSKLRTALQLELSVEPGRDWLVFVSGQINRDFAYQLHDREYTPEVLDGYEQETEFREVYLRGSFLENFDFKLGRQIVVWGKSDNIRVNDVLNPVDNREPGVVDIEDIRLPVTMSRLDYYFGDWGLTGIAVHEIRFNKDPGFGSDFFPLPTPAPPESVPSDGGANTEYGLALSGIFSGFDLSFYWASVFDDSAHLASIGGSADPSVCETPGGCELRHSRLTMVGGAFSLALGNWLLKTEAARFDGLEFFIFPGRDFARFEVLAGFEYSGFTDTTLSFEAVNQRILDFEDALLDPPDAAREDANQYVLAYRADLLRQTLHVVALAILFGANADEGSVRRVSATYDVFDAFSVGAGVVTYHPGNTLLDAGQDNDRLIFDAKYSF